MHTDEVKNYSWGQVATYIPSLARAKPEWFATAFCSSDGQFVQFGDVGHKFSAQSVSKVVAFAMLYEIYHQRGNAKDLFKSAAPPATCSPDAADRIRLPIPPTASHLMSPSQIFRR